jgi:molybdopterin-guanine dinucleotide biosynthesis protein A
VPREELSILKGSKSGRKFPSPEERKRQSEEFWASRPAVGYVLAGGASSRFGNDKALADLGGKSVLERTLELFRASGVREAFIVGPKGKYGRFGARCVKDKWPGEGPLGGIITALHNAEVDKYGYRWCLILSCDMPFLTSEWLRFLIERALQSGAEAVVPKSTRGWEPLCACWRVSTIGTIRPLFEAGTRKVTEALNALRVEVLDEKDWKRFDTSGRLFWNMNTVADYEEARRIVQLEKS